MVAARGRGSARLTGQVAIVTGGGRGIGATISRALAEEGASVAIVGRSPEPLREIASSIEATGGRAVALPADVTDREAVDRVADEAAARLGPVDLLVNNAGSGGVIGPVWELDPTLWWREVEVNLLGPLLFSHAVLPAMVDRQSGRIINVSSGAANHPAPYTSSYASSKAALQRLTDSLAASTKELGIRVFAISPGIVQTAMTRTRIESPEGKKWMPEFGPAASAQWSSPDRAAELCVRLGSGEADGLSGCFIRATEDLDAMIRRASEIQAHGLYTLGLKS